MKRSQLLIYETHSVQIIYNTAVGEHCQSGVLYSVTMKLAIFWPFESEIEVQIPIKDVVSIEPI